MIEAIITTLCMVIVMLACAVRLNDIEDGGHCEKWGYSITGGGALGCALEWWIARGTDWHMDTILAVGLALVALSTMRQPIRHWLATHGFDRRKTARTVTDRHLQDRFGRIE